MINFRKATAATAIATLLAAPAFAPAYAQTASVGGSGSVGVGGSASVDSATSSGGTDDVAGNLSGSGSVDGSVDGSVGGSTGGTGSSVAGVSGSGSIGADVATDGQLNSNATPNANAALNANSQAQGALATATEGSVETGVNVLTSDRVVIGTVQDVEIDADGSQRLTVELDDDLDIDTDRVVLRAGADLRGSNDLRIGMSRADLVASIAAQLQANGTARTSTN